MFTDPEKNVLEFGFMPGEMVVDFGSGSGHYALALSKAVGPTGMVGAVDIQEGLLQRLKSLTKESGKRNVNTVLADLEMRASTGLANDSVEGVLLSNILFQVEDKEAVVAEAERIVKPGGKICVIDWTDKLNKEKVKELLSKNNFVREFDAGNHHYGLIFKK